MSYGFPYILYCAFNGDNAKWLFSLLPSRNLQKGEVERWRVRVSVKRRINDSMREWGEECSGWGIIDYRESAIGENIETCCYNKWLVFQEQKRR